VQGSEAAGTLEVVLKIAILAVAATVAAPGYSASVDDADVDRLTRAGNARAVVFQTLVEQAWVDGEAKERAIVVTAEEVQDAIDDEFSARELRMYLKETGLTKTLLRDRIRSALELAQIRQQVLEPAAKSVTPDQVKAYVDANPQMLPASRTVRLVLAKSRAEAKRIERRLARGATWATVGGHEDELAPSRSRVTKAIFRAKVDEITRYGRVVFRVTEHTPERPMPRAQQEAQAWERLATDAQQHALDTFTAQFTEKWRARTSCAAAYAAHPRCPQPPSGQAAP